MRARSLIALVNAIIGFGVASSTLASGAAPRSASLAYQNRASNVAVQASTLLPQVGAENSTPKQYRSN
jgi:hypothetical protein